MPDFYQNYPTAQFQAAVTEATAKLNQLGNGAMAGQAYEMMLERVSNYTIENPMNFQELREVTLALGVLTQNENIVQDLQNMELFDELVEEILDFVEHVDAAHIPTVISRITKRLLLLYYQRYFSFEHSVENPERNEYFIRSLKYWLESYQDTNRMVLVAKETTDLISGDLEAVLANFADDEPLSNIQQKLRLDSSFEIFIRLRLLRLLVKLRTLQCNQNDDGVQNLFAEIMEHKNVRANAHRFLAEEGVHLLLGLCIEAKVIPIEQWQNFIFCAVGDPRAQRNQHAWQRVGEEQKSWFVGVLSRGDLREFLETMTDGQEDEIYQYRKQFWLQYVDYAVNAKIMLGKNAYRKLRSQNPDMWQRFNSSPETYSRLEDTERSCVFIDFGGFCVIEGTHSAKLRVYKFTPIQLTDKWYRYTEFYNQDVSSFVLLKDFVHTSSEIPFGQKNIPTYTWQNNVRVYLNHWLDPKIKLDNIVLPEHLDPRIMARIRDYLVRNGYIIH